MKRSAQTGMPVAGAGFTLYQNGRPVGAATSDVSGRLLFSCLPPGEYELIESSVPTGFQPGSTTYHVTVSQTGCVTIDGQDANGYSIYNQPVAEGELIFTKVDASTGQPLSGAVFSLPNGVTATSDENGRVDFGAFGPGTYTFQETKPPDGYEADPKTYTVHVSEDGSVTINGSPASGFIITNTRPLSTRPVINSIVEGDTAITGAGVPGATVTVTLSDSTQLHTTVNEDGSWSVSLPSGTALNANDTVYASQQEPGLNPSENASFIVQPRAL